MNKPSKKHFRCFVVFLVAAILVCTVSEQLECRFKEKNFPINQPNSAWSSNDGILTVSVTDVVTIKKTDLIQRYAYEAYIVWNEEQYPASFGFESTGYLPLIRDGRSPHHVDLCLQDSEGIIIETVSCKYYMPNKHTLKLSPIDQQSTAILPETLILSRIDPE